MGDARRWLAWALLVFAPGCQCARIPETACFTGEPCDPATQVDAGEQEDAGLADAGRDAGVDAGADAGSATDAGMDAGVDAGNEPPIDNRLPMLNICQDWGCVSATLPPRLSSPPGFSIQRVPFSGVGKDCAQKYFGGVLLVDGRVLAIPHCADQFLLIDPVLGTAAPIGPKLAAMLDEGGQPIGRYSGAILGCDANVWVMPYGGQTMQRVILPSDGGFEMYPKSLGLTGLPARAMGAALAESSCATTFELFLSPIGGTMLYDAYTQDRHFKSPPADATQPFQSRGVVHNDKYVYMMGNAQLGGGVWPFDLFTYNSASKPFPLFSRIPGDFHGGALGRNRDVYFVDTLGNVTVQTYQNVNTGPHFDHAGAPLAAQRGFRWPATRGDGFIYAMGQSLLAIDEDVDGGIYQLLGPELLDAGATTPTPFAGLVATPQGFVAIPSEFPDVLLLRPDDGGSLPLTTLVSPYFNKL
jgi:hypothetical protein